jgi:hypothetical protein
MSKEEVESILLTNNYLIECKYNCESGSDKSDLTRKYLTSKIKKALIRRGLKSNLIKAFFIFIASIIN